MSRGDLVRFMLTMCDNAAADVIYHRIGQAGVVSPIWTDRACEPETRARVREIMAVQIWSHRLSCGFESGIQIAAETGTLPAVRNEA